MTVGSRSNGDATTAQEVAELAQLRWVSDLEPGIKRVRKGRGFSYVEERKGPIGEKTRARIKALVIPPAWTDVWICLDPHGHLQATGRDRAGRKQYRYHPEWERVRDEVKFDRMGEFGGALPQLRRQVEHDLSGRGLTRTRVIALSVAVLDRTLIRVGNNEYAAKNGAYGLTTLVNDHADVGPNLVRFSFTGKGGQPQEAALRDRRLARLVSQCQELGGQQLFVYQLDNGDPAAITSDDVNAYVRDATGQSFTAKDFRTWGGSALVVSHMGSMATDAPTAEASFIEALDAAADVLGNTRSVCRASYIHPAIYEAHLDGRLAQAWASSRRGRWMERGERALLRILGV